MNNKYFDYYDHISNKFLSALKKSDKQAILLTKIDKYINKKGGSYSTFKPITPLLNTKLNNITKLPKEMGTTKINTVTMAPSMSNINNVINEHYKYLLGIFKTINELIMKINILQKNRVDGTILSSILTILSLNGFVFIDCLSIGIPESIFLTSLILFCNKVVVGLNLFAPPFLVIYLSIFASKAACLSHLFNAPKNLCEI
tara:strand:- start:687 stop:1289 length:603 start_codon:yes stop_codon:yes gene_type:complete